MKTSLLFAALLFYSGIGIGQSTVIKLKTDSSDKYVICFKNNGYRVYFGYKAFFKVKLHDEEIDMEQLKSHVDSDRKHNDTIVINNKFFDKYYHSYDIDTSLEGSIPGFVAYDVATKLLKAGHAKVYSDSTKRFITGLFTQKENVAVTELSYYWVGIERFYYEPGNKKPLWSEVLKKKIKQTWCPSF